MPFDKIQVAMKLVVCVVSGTLALAACPPRTAHLQGKGDSPVELPPPCAAAAAAETSAVGRAFGRQHRGSTAVAIGVQFAPSCGGGPAVKVPATRAEPATAARAGSPVGPGHGRTGSGRGGDEASTAQIL